MKRVKVQRIKRIGDVSRKLLRLIALLMQTSNVDGLVPELMNLCKRGEVSSCLSSLCLFGAIFMLMGAMMCALLVATDEAVKYTVMVDADKAMPLWR